MIVTLHNTPGGFRRPSDTFVFVQFRALALKFSLSFKYVIFLQAKLKHAEILPPQKFVSLKDLYFTHSDFFQYSRTRK